MEGHELDALNYNEHCAYVERLKDEYVKPFTLKDFYKNYIFTFGIIPILKVLSIMEQDENFEECKQIIEAIEEAERTINVCYERRYSERYKNEIIPNISFDLLNSYVATILTKRYELF